MYQSRVVLSHADKAQPESELLSIRILTAMGATDSARQAIKRYVLYNATSTSRFDYPEKNEVELVGCAEFLSKTGIARERCEYTIKYPIYSERETWRSLR